ncbi:MAG TPA: DNA alkylation repair protein [Gammaproteobacteria bacterium]
METAGARDVIRELKQGGDAEQARQLQRFFKTGPGEYGEGDRFLGLRVPAIRQIARRHANLPTEELSALLAEVWHEARLAALLILVEQFKRGDETTRRSIYRFYLAHLHRINNWDLVDLSAPPIVGGWLQERSRAPLHKLARGKNLWERRVAILATFNFIRHNDLDDTLTIATRLLSDREDLIHKATGWMLREVGKRDQQRLEKFLREHYPQLPRTTLRYAIERFPEKLRRYYLNGITP